MERLFGFEKVQADREALKRQQDIMRERQRILSESLTPAQAGDMSVAFQQAQQQPQSIEAMFSQAMTGGSPASIINAPAPEQANLQMTEAKPAQFDAQTAMQRLYGIGDLAGAAELSAAQEKQSRDLNRWSGAVTYIEDPENPGVTIAVQPSTQGDGSAYRKIGVASMTPEARARLQQKDEDQALERERFGVDRQKFLFEQKKFYEGPEVQARTDAMQSLQKNRDSAESTLAVINQIEPYLDRASGSDMEKLARKGLAFAGFDSAAATADRMIDMAAAALTLTAPKLGGAASDRDVALYEQARGNLKSGTTEQKRAAIQFIRDSLQQFGPAASAAAGQSAPNRQSQQAMLSLPNPAQHKGRIVRDTKSGIRYQSNGSQWMRAK